MKKFFLSCLFAFCAAFSYADLAWDSTTGWTATGETAKKLTNDDTNVIQTMNEAKKAQDSKDYGKALKTYRKITKSHGTSVCAPEAYYQSALIYNEKHQYRQAFKQLDKIATKYQDFYNLDKVLKLQFKLAEDLKMGSRPYYFGIIPGFKDQLGSVEFYEKIVRNAPFDEIAPIALMHEAEVYIKDKQFVKAIDTLDRVIDGYPTSELAPMAYIRTAEIYASLVKSPDYDQGATKEAINFYEDFLTIFKDHAMVPYAEQQLEKARTQLALAKINVGDFYFHSRRNAKAAVMMYNQAITVYPDSVQAKIAADKIQAIKNGEAPKSTPVDFLFGNYKRPSDEEWIDEAKLDDSDNEKFDLSVSTMQVDNGSSEKTNMVLSEKYDQSTTEEDNFISKEENNSTTSCDSDKECDENCSCHEGYACQDSKCISEVKGEKDKSNSFEDTNKNKTELEPSNIDKQNK